MATIKEQIRAEIERLEKIDYPCDNYEQSVGFHDALDRVKSFLDTIQEQEDGKALLYVAEKSYNIGLRDGKTSKEQPVEGLEGEIERFCEDMWDSLPNFNCSDGKAVITVVEKAAHHFAEWQRKKDQQLIELAEDHAMLAGMNKMKEEMMEKAVDGMVCATITGTNAISFLSPLPDELNAGDKVKVIFIKEDEI